LSFDSCILSSFFLFLLWSVLSSLETIRWGLESLRSVAHRQLTRPGRLRAEEILLWFAPATQRAVLVFYYQKTFLPAINSDWYATIFRATASVARVGIAFLFLLVVYHGQLWAVRGAIFAASIQNRLQCFVRCFESGRTHGVLAELLSAPHSPQ